MGTGNAEFVVSFTSNGQFGNSYYQDCYDASGLGYELIVFSLTTNSGSSPMIAFMKEDDTAINTLEYSVSYFSGKIKALKATSANEVVTANIGDDQIVYIITSYLEAHKMEKTSVFTVSATISMQRGAFSSDKVLFIPGNGN